MKKYYIILLIISFACTENDKIIELKNGIEKNFILAALERTKHDIIYNGDYFNIEYPNGDIPEEYGVCTDVIIRSYRAINIDLQELIHEDIIENFTHYPLQNIWNQNSADSNIDHRRVPNLEIFFSKYGISIPVSNNPLNYKPGDIVTWNLPGSSPWHIGIVSNKISSVTNNVVINSFDNSLYFIGDLLYLKYFPRRTVSLE